MATESQLTLQWKAFDARRYGFLRFERRRAKNALEKTIKPALDFLKEAGIKQFYDNYDAFIDQEPLKKFYFELYENVGGSFAQKEFENLRGKMKAEVDDQWTQAVRNWIGIAMADRLDAVTNTSKDYIARLTGMAISEGWSIDDLSARIAEKVGGVTRATRIARTEIISASNVGSLEGAKATGLKLEKFWIATRDGRTRESHSAVDGQKRELDEPFTVGGYRMSAPGDWTYGADVSELVNCRCTQGYQRIRD